MIRVHSKYVFNTCMMTGSIRSCFLSIRECYERCPYLQNKILPFLFSPSNSYCTTLHDEPDACSICLISILMTSCCLSGVFHLLSHLTTQGNFHISRMMFCWFWRRMWMFLIIRNNLFWISLVYGLGILKPFIPCKAFFWKIVDNSWNILACLIWIKTIWGKHAYYEYGHIEDYMYYRFKEVIKVMLLENGWIQLSLLFCKFLWDVSAPFPEDKLYILQ
jgi:hypothetical protein